MARIAGINIPQNKVVHVALTYIHGIGDKFSNEICSKCGNIFNEFFNPSTPSNHRCDPKFLQMRSDDNVNTIKSRFATYEKETLPILKYYEGMKLLHQIDGIMEIDQIYGQIRGIIDSL